MKEDLLRYNQGEIALILLELNQAIAANQQWLFKLHRCLITKESIPDEFLQDNTHKTTLFGQWLYSGEHQLLATNSGVQAIEEHYRLLHFEACQLTSDHHHNRAIPPAAYDRFIEHLSAYQKKVSDFRDALIEFRGLFDPLTGLLGRQSLMTTLNKEQSMVTRGLHECAIAMIDIDYFKKVNDTYGHQTGDSALCYLAQNIRFNLRPYDSSFRFGGEEFLVCLPNTNRENALMVMERLRQDIETMPIDLPDGGEMCITVSIGISMMDAKTAIEETLSEADKCLYAAKANGRNRVVMSEPSTI
jgi:diguanylate cyclase (GGDEF)-like protein